MKAEYHKGDGSAPKCPQCFVGLCKKHPMQDHGARTAGLQAAIGDKTALLKKMYDQMVGKELDKFAAFEEDASDKAKYKEVFCACTNIPPWTNHVGHQKMEQKRIKAASKKRKRMSADQDAISRSGLNSQAMMAICRDSDSDSNSDEKRK